MTNLEPTMAERRMFSRRIVRHDIFVDMPISAQALYFHLCMEADDDGFVSSPRLIMRSLGSSTDDLQILIAKRFLIFFDSGVVLVKHWLIHNYIQSDRYSPSTHSEERALVYIKENRAYTTDIDGQSNVSKLDTQVREGKVSIGKKNTDRKKRSADEIKATKADFERVWSHFPKKVGKKKALEWWLRHLVTTETANAMIDALEKYKQTDQWRRGYIPNPLTWLNRGSWEDEIVVDTKPQFKSYATQ